MKADVDALSILVGSFGSPTSERSPEAALLVANQWSERIQRELVQSLLVKGHASVAGKITNLRPPESLRWVPELGFAARANRNGDAALGALQFVVACVGNGEHVSVQAKIGAPSHLFLHGWLLPVAGVCTVSSVQGDLELTSDVGYARFSSQQGGFVPLETPASPWSVANLGQAAPSYAIQTNLPLVEGVYPWLRSDEHSDQSLRQDITMTRIVESLRETLGFLHQNSARYAAWVTGAVAGVLLTSEGQDRAISSSEFPGLVALGPSTSVVACAETLVGQACQQYLRQCLLIAPLVSEGTEEIHYLPMRRTYVTTRRLLATAYEHANALALLYDLQRDVTRADEIRERAMLRKLLYKTECAAHLAQASTLSRAGRSLWERVEALAEL
jgi:HEXXH motif-containing protein